jgi:hypothetical protein
MIRKFINFKQFSTRYSSKLGGILIVSFTISLVALTQIHAQEKSGQNPSNTATNAQANTAQSMQRPQEVEFDARVIQGQRAEGAVYLFQRAPRDLPALLRFKKNNLAPIVEPIFGRTPVVELKAAQAPKDIIEEKTPDDTQLQTKSPRQKKRKNQK